MDYTVHGILQARITGVGSYSSPGIKPRSPTLQADSLPAEPQQNPKNTGVGRPIPSPGDLPNPGIEPGSLALQVDSLPTELSGKPSRAKGIQKGFHPTPHPIPKMERKKGRGGGR